MPKPKPRFDSKREHRITMEIVVDAYNEEERAMGWYCYLEEQLRFPFEARIRQAMAASPLRPSETVSVTGLAHDDLCRVGIFVWVRWNQRDLVVPLAQLVPLKSDESTRVAVTDWHYWHDQGYAF
ncbi:calcium-binding protein [Cupriavidus sp. D39]|uniref:calcium-binding protein n=1 Tax=Cupriavidus sp. D39 TaxID=2997877 RepID=UPI00227111B2|nr:calcium-binding protein [Cupriavidus sp. D39]MCY0853679.1 calcium-binding protein [Cupriavidus sp. D39]